MLNPDERERNDSVDAFPVSPGVGVRSKRHKVTQTIPTRASDDFYRMICRRRGICVIINQEDYSEHARLKTRNGSSTDAENLKKTFENLSFEVKLKANLSKKLFEEELQSWSDYNHNDCDAFVLCLLSHGDTESIQHPKGRTPFNKLFEPFTGENCPSLLGKPKLFFIQACQGGKLPERISVKDHADAGEKIEDLQKEGVYRFPTHADFLVAYATVPGFAAFREDSEGAYFIRSLCSKLQDMHLVQTRDILSLLRLVNKDVALNFVSSSQKKELNDRKQQACVYYSLTRKLYLMPKGTARFHSHSA